MLDFRKTVNPVNLILKLFNGRIMLMNIVNLLKDFTHFLLSAFLDIINFIKLHHDHMIFRLKLVFKRFKFYAISVHYQGQLFQFLEQFFQLGVYVILNWKLGFYVVIHFLAMFIEICNLGLEGSVYPVGVCFVFFPKF